MLPGTVAPRGSASRPHDDRDKHDERDAGVGAGGAVPDDQRETELGRFVATSMTYFLAGPFSAGLPSGLSPGFLSPGLPGIGISKAFTTSFALP